MSNPIASTKKSSQRVSLLASMQTKLTLIVAVPAVILGAAAIGAQSYSSGISNRAIDDIVRTSEHSLELAESAQQIQATAGDFKDDLIVFTQAHQKNLLKNRKSSGMQGAGGLEKQAANLSALVDRDLASLRDAMTGSMDRMGSEFEASAMFEKRYNFVVRNARNLPRLLDIYLASHERTTALLADGAADPARANYTFEESARSHALTTSVERMTEVLDSLAADVAHQMASDMDATVADAKSAASAASTMVDRGVVGAMLILTVLAVFIIRASVNRPMVRITAAMRQLADGDLDTKIDESGRNDELGQMAAALGVFRANALTNKRLQEEKVAKAEADALEAEEKAQE